MAAAIRVKRTIMTAPNTGKNASATSGSQPVNNLHLAEGDRDAYAHWVFMTPERAASVIRILRWLVVRNVSSVTPRVDKGAW